MPPHKTATRLDYRTHTVDIGARMMCYPESGGTSMANIGDPIRRIISEPEPISVPVPEPAPEKEPDREPEPVPA